MTSLDQQLLEAHAAEDTAALVALYAQAAASAQDPAARGFYLTHAYVYALETGSPEAPQLRQKLIDMGRETPLHSETTSPL